MQALGISNQSQQLIQKNYSWATSSVSYKHVRSSHPFNLRGIILHISSRKAQWMNEISHMLGNLITLKLILMPFLAAHQWRLARIVSVAVVITYKPSLITESRLCAHNCILCSLPPNKRFVGPIFALICGTKASSVEKPWRFRVDSLQSSCQFWRHL